MDPAKGGPVLAAVAAFVQGLRPGAGGNWIGFCPVHGETPGKSKPSFSFNVITGQWNCFSGCGAGGLPQLLRSIGRSRQFVDRTMERLRPYLKPVAIKRPSTLGGGVFSTDYPLPEKILGLFEYAPESLLIEGFSEEVLFENDVGFDPERGRVTYAIRDLGGTLAGISGKPVQDGVGKYLVYERELREMGFRGYHFSNRDFMWRWEKVYSAVYRAENPGPVLVTEGFKACLWFVQHGYRNTVALMGTTLSATQQLFLERLGTRIILCLDWDKWGRIGTDKICHKLPGLDVAVMRYPFPEAPKLQPDYLTGDELRDSVENPLTVRSWRRLHHEHSP